MTTIVTDTRRLREGANRIRFGQTLGIRGTNVQDAIEHIASVPQTVVTTPVPAGTPVYNVDAETFLAVDSSGGPVTIQLPTAASRGGVPIVIKDASGDAFTNNVSILAAGGDTMDGGGGGFAIATAFGGFRLVPQANRWMVSP